LEKEPPVAEASRELRTVHRFDVVKALTVHGLPEPVLDPSQPVGLQGFALWVREVLVDGKAAHVVDLYGAKRPIVRQAVNPAEGHSSKTVVQALHNSFGPVA
jgi:hypothetical protein